MYDEISYSFRGSPNNLFRREFLRLPGLTFSAVSLLFPLRSTFCCCTCCCK